LGDAGTEAVGLNQHANQGANVVDASAFGQITHGFGAGLAGAHFEVDEAELLAEFGVGVVEILGNAHERLVETETGLHTDDSKIQGIRQRQADAELTFLDRAFEQESGENEAKQGPAEKQERGRDSDSGEQANAKSEERAKDPKSSVERNAFRIPVTGLHQHEARAGGAVGGQRESPAERIESLLQAFPQLGFLFGAPGVVASERPEAFSEDRERGRHCRTEQKDDGNNGQENDDGDYDFHGLGLYQYQFFTSSTPESE
jgi:hypothetical protein